SPQRVFVRTSSLVVLSHIEIHHRLKRGYWGIDHLKITEVSPVATAAVVLGTTQVIEVRAEFAAGRQTKTQAIGLSPVVVEGHIPTIQNVNLRIGFRTEGVVHSKAAVLKRDGIGVKEAVREV